MDSSIRRTLWAAFAALTTLVAIGLAVTVIEAPDACEIRVRQPFQSHADAMITRDKVRFANAVAVAHA